MEEPVQDYHPCRGASSTLLMQAFDDLLLLKRGGRTIYAGSLGKLSADLISYFEAIPNVPNISGGINPATWMLEVKP